MREICLLGSFTIESGKVMVSDPCYDRGTWCQAVIDNVKNGRWNGYVVRKPDPYNPFPTEQIDICSRIFAVHVGCDNHEDTQSVECTEPINKEIGVDSGQAGIFDLNHFHGGADQYGDKGWYDLCCEATAHDVFGADVIFGGMVSSSGYGDGGYECYVARNDQGEVISIELVFVGDKP
jgi:hypothetical protein